MRKFKIVAWLSAALLAACGGGNTLTGSNTGGGTGGATVAAVTVSSSVASIAADGSDSATITAVAKDSNNNFVQGATVTFTSTSGGLAITQATTDVNGQAKATLTSAGTAAGTAITVTATTGGVSGTATVNVVNTQQTITLVTSLPQIPSDSSKAATITALVRGSSNQFLSGVTVSFQASSGGLTVTQAVTDVNGAATATLNAANDPTNRRITVTATAGTSTATVPVDVTGTKLTIAGPQNLVQGGQPGTYTVSLTDSGNVGIAGKTIAVTSAAGNAITSSPVTTDSTGTGTLQLAATTAGNDTLTASALGLTATQSVSISNQSFVITTPVADAKINLGAVQPVTLVWTVGGVAQAGQTITFATTRGTLSAGTAVTDGSGTATVNVSSTTAGPAVISASGTNVSTQVTVDFLATTPASVAVQASPSTIPTEGQSTIFAIVRDAQNNLVEGKTVNFQLTDNTGGSLSVASGVTDSQGKAQTVYTASTTPSASNGVSIAATVSGTAVTGSTTLTVGGQTVFLSLGTGNTINKPNAAQYDIDYAIQAIDSAGNGLDGKQIALTVESLKYVKGSRAWNGAVWATPTTPLCNSEDVNFNGILDTGEDFNGNLKLDPGNVASVSPANINTSGGGSALVKVIYPKDHAYWVQVRLTATTTVAGTQSSTSADFWLPGAADDFNTQNIAPPGPDSPYGVGVTCADPN
jgi:hypothetical protein